LYSVSSNEDDQHIDLDDHGLGISPDHKDEYNSDDDDEEYEVEH